MKRITFLLVALIVGAFALQMEAQPQKGPSRSDIFNYLPSGYTQLGTTSIYYSIQPRDAVGPGTQTGISILGEIGGRYYSSTYEWKSLLGWLANGPGAGFIAAFQVNSNPATYVNCATGTTSNGVNFTANIEPMGEVAARIIYSLKNNTSDVVTINAGVWGDIMIGDNDRAPLEPLKNSKDFCYGIKMKHSNSATSPLLCMLFGEGVTGVNTSADDYWFGFFENNYSANEMAGHYSTNISNYMQEGGGYDCGLGFCWKDREIAPGETLELSYVVSVGEVEYEEPFVPGDDRFEYEVEAFNFDGWNDLSVAHPAHVFGYYEHPYAQNGYIEYMVDGNRGEWTRIPTQLISGEEFDLPFDMFFDENVTTTHTLSLRFNDGLDNLTPMDGLSWTDVRSIPINGLEDRPYTGDPQIFEVTIGDGEPFTIGENGEYTNPGDYTFGFEGDFNDNTIGVNEVEFTIGKGQSVINVTVPEDCTYDGLEHPATYVLLVGDGAVNVTYVNTETGEATTEAPVEPGTYEVFVSVEETALYYGIEEKSYGSFTIGKLDPDILVNIPEDCVYDGNEHAATAELIAGDGQIVITYVNTETGEVSGDAPVEPGTYDVFVEVINSVYYNDAPNTNCGTFTIDKAQAVVVVVVPDDVEYDGEAHGATVTVTVGDAEAIVTYLNSAVTPPQILNEAPVEVGIYEVFVSVPETDHYYGVDEASYGIFEIYKGSTSVKEMMIGTEDNGAWYTIDGRRVDAPTQGGIFIHNGKKYILK